MLIMLFDVETSDLPNFNLRARDPSQPHIVAAAAVLIDEMGDTLESFYKVSIQKDWLSSPEAFAAHGITRDRSLAVGIPEEDVTKKLMEWIWKAETVAAYNQQFDKFLLRIAGRRFEILDDAMDAKWKALPMICVMKPFTQLCKIPFANGRPGFKFPKLQEAYRWAFGKEFAGAHNAAQDLKATVELYMWLRNNGKV